VEVRQRSASLDDNDVKQLLSIYLRKLNEILENIFPSPLPYVAVRTPVSEDTIRIAFDNPVHIPIIIIPISSGIYAEIGEKWNTFTSAKIDIDSSLVSGSALSNYYNAYPVYDIGGSTGLTYLLSQEFINVIRPERISSNTGIGAEWMRNLIEVAKELREMTEISEVKSLNPLDLLSKKYRTTKISILLRKPSEDMSIAKLLFESIPTEKTTRRRGSFEVDFVSQSGWKGYVYFTHGNNEVRFVKISADSGEKRKVIDYLVTLFSESLLDKVAEATRKFLDDYKVFRVALSLVNL